jgi:hypothetical protein
MGQEDRGILLPTGKPDLKDLRKEVNNGIV